MARQTILEFIDDLGIDVANVSNKGWARACCPVHEETRPSFGVLTTYPYSCKCFACGFSRSLVWLTSYLKKWSLGRAADYIHENLEVKFDFENNTRKNLVVPDAVYEAYADAFNKSPGSRFLRRRGYPKWAARLFDVGYDELSKSVVVPMRNVYTRKVQGFYRQFLLGDEREKDCDEAGRTVIHPTSIWTFDKCYVVEGYTDALGILRNLASRGVIDGVPVALGGASFSAEQVVFLRNFRSIVVAFDHDDAGERGKLRMLKNLSDHPRVFELSYPEHLKDPGELSPNHHIKSVLSLTKPNRLLFNL